MDAMVAAGISREAAAKIAESIRNCACAHRCCGCDLPDDGPNTRYVCECGANLCRSCCHDVAAGRARNLRACARKTRAPCRNCGRP